DGGMFRQIEEACEDLGIKASTEHIVWLRDLIREVIEEELSRAATLMKFIQGMAQHLLEPGRIRKPNGKSEFPPRFRSPPGTFMEWVTSSGFPVANSYRQSVKTRVCLPFLGSNPVIADEYSDLVKRTKVINSVVANLVHSLDAAHLCRSINRAVREGIVDLMSVHDCYGTLAPDVGHFARIRREEIASMYAEWDPLPELLKANGITGMELPERDPAFDLVAVGRYSTYFDR